MSRVLTINVPRVPNMVAACVEGVLCQPTFVVDLPPFVAFLLYNGLTATLASFGEKLLLRPSR
jgi:hypothetical protein